MLLLLAAGCNTRIDDTIIVGRSYACLFDTRLECQILDDLPELLSGQTEPPDLEFEQVVGADHHLCGIPLDGDPVCWGWNENGQTDIPANLDVAYFALGYVNTCSLDSSGYPTCWGNVWTGVNEPPEGPFDELAVANEVGCGWSAEDGWTCWGNEWGVEEDSHGDRFEWNIPPEDPVSIVSGDLNICMLDDAGRISCWGYANYGLDDPPDGEGWHDLSVGTGHACAFDYQGVLMCWGFDINAWWRMFPDGDWVSYKAGGRADCGIRTDGEVVCWGCVNVDPLTCNWD